MFKTAHESSIEFGLSPLHVSSRDADSDTAGLEVTQQSALIRAKPTFLVGGNSKWTIIIYSRVFAQIFCLTVDHKFVIGCI